MGRPEEPKPAKLIMSLLSRSDDLLHRALELLQRSYGEVDFKSDPLPFHWTRYYEREMGPGLFRRFVSFAPFIRREALVEVKLHTNEVEASLAEGDKRRVNIDPGYITAEHLILASTKGAPHRPYLGRGIYADLTLLYREGAFRPLEWTYPDYASEEVRRLLEGVRRRYLEQLRELRDD